MKILITSLIAAAFLSGCAGTHAQAAATNHSFYGAVGQTFRW